jgi:hypothetical protein
VRGIEIALPAVFDPKDINPPLIINARIAKLSRRRALGKAAFAKSKRLIN